MLPLLIPAAPALAPAVLILLFTILFGSVVGAKASQFNTHVNNGEYDKAKSVALRMEETEKGSLNKLLKSPHFSKKGKAIIKEAMDEYYS